MEIATLAGGCFWCLEAVFDQLKGVESVESGYMGGAQAANPTYEEVCSGTTGHAEVVQVDLRPRGAVVRGPARACSSRSTIRRTLNRQGNDVGTQYRSAIFYHSAAAEARPPRRWSRKLTAREALRARRSSPRSRPRRAFFVAEDYHQEYFARMGAAIPTAAA